VLKVGHLNNVRSATISTQTRRHSESSNPRRIAVVSQMCTNIGVIVISVKNALINLVHDLDL